MKLLVGIAGIALLLLILRDAFETVILPRRIARRFRFTALFYRVTWRLWRGIAIRLSSRVRETVLSWYGPLSLLMLLALWALGIMVAFGTLQWAAGSAIKVEGHPPGFLDDLYLSGTTFVTLGLGDVVPRATFAKVMTATEAGLGFAFLAIIIGYLPVVYQAFSRREIAISMLDARAGSPPAAGELLARHGPDGHEEDMVRLLAEWEHWAAELLESHLSYPVLGYFRSQHGNQSWLSAITTVLDASALSMIGCEGRCQRQAQLTFAMARHAMVDLAQVFRVHRPTVPSGRLPDEDFTRLREQLVVAKISLDPPATRRRLNELRALYEPYVIGLSLYFALPLPAWTRSSSRPDNWQMAPWKALASAEPEHLP